LVLTKRSAASSDENARSLANVDILTRLFQSVLAAHSDSIAIYEITDIPCALSLFKRIQMLLFIVIDRCVFG